MALDDGKGLANNTLRNVDKMNFEKITAELKKSVDKLKNKTNKEFSQKMDTVKLIPTW